MTRMLIKSPFTYNAPMTRQAPRFGGSETSKEIEKPKSENNNQSGFSFLTFPKLKDLTKEITGALKDMFASDSSDTASGSNKVSPEQSSLYGSFSQEKKKTD
jgi:hypothetical protein